MPLLIALADVDVTKNYYTQEFQLLPLSSKPNIIRKINYYVVHLPHL